LTGVCRFAASQNDIMVKYCLIALTAILFWTCQPASTTENPPTTRDYFASDTAQVKSGGVRLIPVKTASGTYNVWTKRIGNNPKIKVLLLHGGPACTHEYFECLESYLPGEGIEFIYYDQLGSLYSDKPTDDALWTTERFVDELEQVRQALGLDKDNFFLLGHSWGGILAMEYTLKYQQHMKGLIISNMMASCPKYDQYAEQVLAKQMPAAVVDSILDFEAKGDYENPRYFELLMPHFYNKHICRLPMAQWPDPMSRGLNHINRHIYVLMQGPSEFGIAGRLASWDRSADLGLIQKPTLVIGATHDTMDPKYMEWMAGQVPQGTFLLCPNGSHFCMWDDQAVYMNGLIAFLLKNA
jgi:proline iminopeptidase